MDEKLKTKHKVSQNLIYGYSDPETNEVKYIGKSSSGLLRARNFKGHLHGKVGIWIKGLKAKGLKPHVVILEELTSEASYEDLVKAELNQVSLYPNLLNAVSSEVPKEDPKIVYLKRLIKLARKYNLQHLKIGDTEMVLNPELPVMPDLDQFVNPFNVETPEEFEQAKKAPQPDPQTQFEQYVFPDIPDFNEDPLGIYNKKKN